jgi:hypothetical protein
MMVRCELLIEINGASTKILSPLVVKKSEEKNVVR